jgi:EmrB/QacA subfamily drug resistance transporter
MTSFIKKWLPLAILSAAVGIVTMDMTITNVSLSAIIRDLHTNLRTFQWIVTGYSLVFAALTITGGRLGDIFGHKKIFLIGATIFAAGSLIAAVAHQAATLLLGLSVIEGIGAALMLPASSALVLAMYQEKKARAIAFGIYAGVAGLMASIGPILGGYLTTYHSWRWSYLINPVVILLLLIGSRVLHEARAKHRATLDVLSIALSALGLGGIVFGIIESSAYGWFRAKEGFALFGHSLWFNTISVAFSGLVMGLFLLAIFVWRQKKLEGKDAQALVSMQLLTNRQFMAGVFTNLILTGAQYGVIFLLPVFWQIAHGYNAFHAGLASVALPLSILVAAPIGGVLTGPLGFQPKRILQLGSLLSAAGMMLLHYIVTSHATALGVAPGLIIFGIGFGLTLSPIANQTLSAVLPEQTR